MSVPGFATGGASLVGQSRAFASLPWENYRSISDWIEEMVDAMGGDFDIWWARFVGSRFETDGLNGRTKLLDLDYEPAEVASSSLATATAAPTAAKVQDTMLDVLLYLAGIPWPVDGNWTTAQKREMVRVGWSALQRKSTRKALLKLVAGPMFGVVYGVSLPPWAFSYVHGDGSPGPGYLSDSIPVVTLAGTVATSTANATVTGTGTAFVTDGSWNGLLLIIDNQEYWISSVASATSLTLTTNGTVIDSGLTARIVYPAVQRPWLFEANRNLVKRIFPGWAELGVGYSQFRAGFSAAGEPVLATGSRVSLLLNENFTDFSGAAPDSWTASGTITRATCEASPTPEINHEFTSYCAQFDMTAAAAGDARYLYQSATINNQIPHRLEIDYGYTNDQLLDNMYAYVIDISDLSGNQYYWTGVPVSQSGTISVTEGSREITGSGTAFDTTGAWAGMPLKTAENRTYLIERVRSATSLIIRETPLYDESGSFSVSSWTTTDTPIALPVGTSATGRLRHAIDVYPRRYATASGFSGTASVDVYGCYVESDGTDSTQVVYSLYRVGLHEKHDPLIEAETSGEQTLSLPLRDSLGWSQITSTGTGTLVEPASYDRGSFAVLPAQSPRFDYHPALGRRGYRNTGTWTNALLQSNSFSAWTASGATYNGTAASADLFASALAGSFTASTTSAYVERASGTTAGNKSWLHGLWAKRVAADPGYQASTITITAGSATVTAAAASFVTGGAWTGVEIMTAAGNKYTVASVGSTTSLTLAGVAGRTETAVQYKVADFRVALLYGSTEGGSSSFFVTQADGWTMLACPPVTLGAVAGDVGVRVYFLGQSSGDFYLSSGYAYDVTGTTDVLYPPVCITDASTKTTGVTYLDAITDNVGSDVKSETLKTSLVSVSRGALALTIVPTFGAASQPNATILDVGQSSTQNLLRLHVASGELKVTRINDATTSTTMGLALIASDSPTSTQMTWRRDEAINILLRWNDDGTASLSAGNGNVAAALSAAPYVDTSVDTLRIGANVLGAGAFDGHICDLEIVQVGTPTT